MSGPPPGFNPAASVLPDNLSARIEIVQGGGGSGAPSINQQTKKDESSHAFSAADQALLEKQGLQKGGPIDAVIDGPTRTAFLEQVRAGRCGADSGEMVILHKDCWAVVQVIRALLRHGMEKQKGLLPKSEPKNSTNIIQSPENSDQTFETFSNSENDGVSFETFSNDESTIISEEEKPTEEVKEPVTEPIEEAKEPPAEPSPELTEEEIQKRLQNLEAQVDKEMAEEKEKKIEYRKERNQDHLDYLQEQRKILIDMKPVTSELSKERNQLVSQVNSMTAQVQERMKRHTGGQGSKKKMTRAQKLFRKATKTTRKNRK